MSLEAYKEEISDIWWDMSLFISLDSEDKYGQLTSANTPFTTEAASTGSVGLPSVVPPSQRAGLTQDMTQSRNIPSI